MEVAPRLRGEAPGDAASIRALTEAAFAGTPYADGTEAAIPGALRDDGALTLSLVADAAGVIVGHVAFSPVTIDGADLGWVGLGPVSVQPALQRHGIGGALIRLGLARLRADGAAGCVLLGDPGYYSRFGFVADPALKYPGPPPKYFQCLAFSPPRPSGTVAFHPAFSGG